MKNKLFLFAFLLTLTVSAQTSTIKIGSVSNYKQWGWNAIVMKNKFITVATIPEIGGRVMQYDLGTHASIFVNEAELGKTYTPMLNDIWPNFGGFKNWPAPQHNWHWPPPPTLDYGEYKVKDMVQSPDSVSLTIESGIEQWRTPGLQFGRRATVYAGTSRVKMEQTIVNNDSVSGSWSVWDITQMIVHHPGKNDYENFWAYFPINPRSAFGKAGARFQYDDEAWKGEVSFGVYGIQFHQSGKKIFGDPSKGWIAYADLADSIVCVKTFDVVEGAQYPDNGGRVAVFVGGRYGTYMEVEVTSPLTTIAPNGGRFTFTENWWMAKMKGPVLDANTVGAIAARMKYDSVTHTLSGRYGIFYEGYARAIFYDSLGKNLGEGKKHAVSPCDEFDLEEALNIPEGTKYLEIKIYDIGGKEIGILENMKWDVRQ